MVVARRIDCFGSGYELVFEYDDEGKPVIKKYRISGRA